MDTEEGSGDGLRERKAARTREAISRVAINLFCDRGFDAVTMSEIAKAAEVGRATVFAYFPTKESLVLDRDLEGDPCQRVRGRAPGVSLVEALRGQCEEWAAAFGPQEIEGTKRVFGLVVSTPALMDGVYRMFDRQRDELATLLQAEDGREASGLTAQVAAAQAIGVVTTLRSRFLQRLAGGESAEVASRSLAEETSVAFALLENGIGDCYRKEGAR